jgi:phosphoadenosine phosphosulfate reductase
MTPPDLVSAAEDARALADLNHWLASQDAEARIDWMLDTLPGDHVLSSSFGAQAAAMLHLVTQRRRDIPVILIDTGYLFPETYRFADTLTERLGLNLKVYRPQIGIAWMEARLGRLWEHGLDGIERYNRLRKVEPMQRALNDLDAKGWIVGLRRSQSSTRKKLDVLGIQNGFLKVHPIVDWNDKKVFDYMFDYDLPYHPLWEQGYISIGDVHSTRALHEVEHVEQTRFAGLKRECGLHEINLSGL